MAKGASFADKSKGKKTKDYTYIKYVKSERSEKTNHWRFNEQMIRLNSGENLDSALKRMEQEVLALDMELPVLEDAVEEHSEENGAPETQGGKSSDEIPEQVVEEPNIKETRTKNDEPVVATGGDVKTED